MNNPVSRQGLPSGDSSPVAGDEGEMEAEEEEVLRQMPSGTRKIRRQRTG